VKRVLFMVLIIGCIALQTTMAQVGPVAHKNVLSENFEGTWFGGAPVGWSNVYITGSADWAQATGGYLSNPPTAHSGDYNARLFLQHSSATNYQTRLITPVMDLNPQIYSNAVLSFWLAQVAWFGDWNNSYVYYRTSSVSAWAEVPGGSFTNAIDTWTEISLTLPNICSTYQLAFVGEIANEYATGYGVCIDDVSVDGLYYPIFVDNDFNGDGITELTVYYPMSGTWYIKNTNGTEIEQFGWEDAIPVSGDYDGDGFTDIAVYWPEGGRWFIRYTATGLFDIIDWGWSDAVPVPADYNGDRKIDVAVYDPDAGFWYIRYPNNVIRTETLGASTQIPVPADYDGDRKADIGVYDMTSGDWNIVLSSTQPPLSFNLGGTGAMPVPGDYDGDTLADPAVYSPASGTWAFLPGTPDINWGWSAAVPVPSDYDGTRKVGVGVYESLTGDWYIRHSDMSIPYNFGWSEATPATPAYQTLKWFGLVP